MNPTERNQEYYLNDIPLEQAVESYFDSLYKQNSFSRKRLSITSTIARRILN